MHWRAHTRQEIDLDLGITGTTAVVLPAGWCLVIMGTSSSVVAPIPELDRFRHV